MNTTVQSGGKLKRLDFLDALRGLAAAYVVVYHMILLPNPNLVAPDWAYKVAHSGGTGVMLFFVISAFSLYYTMPLRLRDAHPNLSFYLHRFFRIAPLFYAWIFFTLVRDAWYFSAHHGASGILASITFLFNLTPQGQQGFVWASWTIGIEMMFYLMFPLIYRYITDLWKALALVFIFILVWLAYQAIIPHVYSGANVELVRTWTFVRFLPVFALGGVVHFVISRIHAHGETEYGKSIGLFVVVASIYCYLAMLDGSFNVFFEDARVWQGLIYSALVVGLCLNPLKIFVNRFTVYLGKISYSLYLGHTTVVLFLTPVYRAAYSALNNTTLAFLLCYVLTLLLAMCLADITYRFIEAPGVRYGKIVYQRMAGWLGQPLRQGRLGDK
jgi:peptidoglycan/LPS O-acetylase OafA/YrhL